MKILRGIAWGHSRGFTPYVATSQRYHELHPEINFVWEKRSLKDFGEGSFEAMLQNYDLIILDHPYTGIASRLNKIVSLSDHLPDSFLQDQALNSVGLSHASYFFDGKQYALAVDAAAPVSQWRPDLLHKNKADLPKTWEEVLLLAKKGKVLLPGIHTDTLHHFYAFCMGLGEIPFEKENQIVSLEVMEGALTRLQEIIALIPPFCLQINPIGIYEILSSTDEYWYCPMAFGYSNYSRPGYGNSLILSGEPPLFNGTPMRTSLGGAGIALSSSSQHQKEAIDYMQWIASSSIQKTIYVESGGQPGHRSAWIDDEVNRRNSDFFRNTLPALDRAWLRPRDAGYHQFQDAACYKIDEFLKRSLSLSQCIQDLNQINNQKNIL